MINKKTRFLASSALVAMVLGNGVARAQDHVAAPVQADSRTSGAEATGLATTVTDIVVTATREPVELRKAPVAVSSVSGATLTSRGLVNLNDLKQQLPNVQIGDSYVESRIAIRGVGGQSIQLGASPGVAYYVDGVYLERTGLATATFFDLDRVEVLRGPQGALYGRNATGGAINIIPNKPSPEFSGMVGASVGADPWAYGLQGVVNGGLNSSGTLSARVSAQRTYNKGFTRNLNSTGPRRFDDANNYSVRSQIRLNTGSAFDANLALDYQKQNTNGVGIYYLGTPTGVPTAAENLGGKRPNLSDRTIYANQGQNDRKFYGATLSVSSEGDWGTLGLKAGIHHTAIDLVSEADGTDINFSYSFFGQKGTQQFGELVYNSPALGSIRFLVGGNILHEIASQQLTVNTPPANRVTSIYARIPTFSYALFGRANLDISSNWRGFAGVRYSHDRKSLRESNNFLNGGVPGRQEAQWGDITYEVGTSIDLTQRISAYVKYATGFKAGGFSGGSFAPAFAPEKDKSIEGGVKGSLPNNRGRFSLVAFHTPYTNMQVNQVRGFSAFISNAGKSTINGVEFEGFYNIVPALRFDLVASLLDAKFDSFSTIDSARPALGTLDLSGNYLPKAPKFSGSSALTYTHGLAQGGKLAFTGRYNWQSRVFYTEFNLPVSTQKAVGRIDLTLDFESADKLWNASVFVNNVADKSVVNNVIVASATLSSAALANLDPGRRIGASLTRRF